MAICERCGVAIPVGHWPFCPHGARMAFAEHGDEMDEVIHNLGRHPIRVRSKAEHRRLLKERGLVQMVRHVPHPAGNRKNHTVDWACVADDYTVRYKQELLERAFRQRADPPEAPGLRMQLESGEMSKAEVQALLDQGV